MKTLHNNYCNSKQGYLPLFLSDCLDLLDSVLTFDRLMGGIDLNKYLTDIPEYTTGRLIYNPVNMLKTVLFGFMTSSYCSLRELDTSTFVYGSGKRKSKEQRHYEHLTTFCQKLQEYIQKIEICGPNRNSYSKTDNSATFMRIKTDYMGNDQLLPAYNVQIGVADEYIAVVDVNHYRSDMDCFIPLMKHFKQTYGFYPKYPVADAGYGSYNNYIFCEQNGMEKYMKFPMFKKETKERKYHEDPFRAVNFRIDEQGVMRCPNDKAFHLLYRRSVRGNQYGRKEELYECEDCSGCPYAEKCKKTDKNRTVRINQELTSMHQEVIENLESIHDALLRMNRSIQAEGTFVIMKNDH